MKNFNLFKAEELLISKFDMNRAKFLHKELTMQKRMKGKRPNLENWALEFQKLRLVNGIKKSRIKEVLKWYCKNIRKKQIPLALSARSFRSKFPHIEMAMEIDQGPRKIDLNKIKITEDARYVEKQCGHLIWPDKYKKEDDSSENKKLELQVIQASLNQYEKYLGKLHKISRQVDPYPKSVIKYIFHQEGDPRLFIEFWMEGIHQTAWEWDGWKGNLEAYIFDFNLRRYERHVEELLRENWDDPNCWVNIKEYLNSESQSRKSPRSI